MDCSEVRRFRYWVLPDVVAVNNNEATLLSIEAKSGTGDALYVQPDQIQRCLLIRDMFGYYRKKHVILAFKFMRKKGLPAKGRLFMKKEDCLSITRLQID